MVKVEAWDEATQKVVVRELTREEYLAEFGADAMDVFADPKPESEMTEGERYLLDKMQSEQEVHNAFDDAGIDSIFDLPQDDDHESVPLDDLVPQEYDDAGADADYRARSA